MGDNFLEEQARNTKKRRAKGGAALRTEKLFKRADNVVDHFTVECDDGYELKPGDILFCFPSQNGRGVEVSLQHKAIGVVAEDGGATALTESITAEGVGQLRVVSFDALAGAAQVELQGN